MTKAELIERIARSRNLPADITKRDIERIVTLAFEEIASYFVRAKVTRTSTPKFSFPHFGTFVKKRRSARRGVNPRTLEPMVIDAFYALDFRDSAQLREAMNQVRAEGELGGRRARRRDAAEVVVDATDDEQVVARGDAAELPEAPLARVRAPSGSTRARSA
jgi:nucleoid DNA-binding protein